MHVSNAIRSLDRNVKLGFLLGSPIGLDSDVLADIADTRFYETSVSHIGQMWSKYLNN